jgi:hypothetical protein
LLDKDFYSSFRSEIKHFSDIKCSRSKAEIWHFRLKEQNTRYGIFRPQIKPEDEDLLRCGAINVSQAFKGFVASG